MHRRWTTTMAALTAATIALGLPAHAQNPDPVAERKAGPLSPVLKELAGLVPASGIATATALAKDSGDRLLVDLRVSETTQPTLDQLTGAGAIIRTVDEKQRSVTVAVSPKALPAIAGVKAVEYAAEVLTPFTNYACPSGPNVSEGAAQLRATLARTQFSVTGRDVTVGIISDGYDIRDGESADVTNGELPGTSNPCEHTTAVSNYVEGPDTSNDEGRAMAQIVHDIAPDAHILFASGMYGDPAMAQSIRNLAYAGADIIVDDLGLPYEPLYQDGVVGKAIDDVTAAGVVYVSAAGNANTLVDGMPTGNYETAAFRPASCPAAISIHYGQTQVTCHDFDIGSGVDTTYGMSMDWAAYALGWNEPMYGLGTDLDLCLVYTNGGYAGCMESDNLAWQLPVEAIQVIRPGDYAWVVVRYAGTGTPGFRLLPERSALTSMEYTAGETSGDTFYGHSATASTIGVGAVPYNNAHVLESFSSTGTARFCWQPVAGTTASPAIPGCYEKTVSIVATDGVRNSFFGGGTPHRFLGTSAAAPHAAGVAALMLDREQCLTPAQVREYLTTTGRPVGTTSPTESGGGLIDAVAALTAAGAAACDRAAPVVHLRLPGGTTRGWYTTQPVNASLTATDRRTISSLHCTKAGLSDTAGLGTPNATAGVKVRDDGQHDVDCEAIDGEGNSGHATATVRIDTTGPQLTCRPATFLTGDSGAVTATVSDPLSGPAVETVSAAVTASPPGSFEVTLTAGDLVGNTTSTRCGYTVTAAADTTAPTLTCRPARLIAGEPGLIFADVRDDESGPAHPEVWTRVDADSLGTFTVGLTGSDAAGNTATVTCGYTVVSPPQLSGPARVRAGTKARFTATGLTGNAAVTWSLHRGSQDPRITHSRSTARGEASHQFRLRKTGRYGVKVTCDGVTLQTTVRVK